MKKMGLNEIRTRFLEFFESKEHLVLESFPLVPQKDKTLLLINAGMVPLKNYFAGIEEPPSKRMASCQKCFRTNDIDNVGHTSRHATFFEMLGNFSIGDYFKSESIAWGWEFITEVLELPLDKLWVTVYLEDDEAYDIWANEQNFPKDRIVRLGKEDNFWSIGTGTGPCGPCSEIYYDRGPEAGCDDPDCKPGCDCDRFVEFWNHVFTQFDQDIDGNYNLLPKPNIDTGMGLERMAAVVQEVDSIFEVDTIKHILDKVVETTGVPYGREHKTDISLRIITDHIRAVSFLVCDGVLPNNEGRGYVLRRILRRAARHGKLLGVRDNFLYKLVDEVISVSGEAYPELVKKSDFIKKVISIEEDRFQQTIDQGLEILNGYIDELEKEDKDMLSGENAFKLYDTYGFPLDLTREIIEERNMTVDEDEFNKCMEEQRERARSAREEMGDLGWASDALAGFDGNETEFIGYDNMESSSKIIAIINKDGEMVDTITEVGDYQIVLDKTAFYAESGGQVGDKGKLLCDGFEFIVHDCKKAGSDVFVHYGEVALGSVSKGDDVQALVDKSNRFDIMRNHTATHLLHKALKNIVGEHVDQAGSLVQPDRLRFDFTHFSGLTNEEIIQIETEVNDKIFSSYNVKKREMSISEARELGATALFGEKYGDVVRVVSIEGYSIELCGGTHLDNTSEIGMFKIVSESGVAAGVRRIEAITGRKVLDHLNNYENTVMKISNNLKTRPEDLENRVDSLIEENKELSKEIKKLKEASASGSLDDVVKAMKEINGVSVIAAKLEGIDIDTLRNFGDKLKDKYDSTLLALAAVNDDKANIIVMANENAVKKGVHAGNVIKEIMAVLGGRGGGRPNMAQGGAGNSPELEKALEKAYEFVEKLI